MTCTDEMRSAFARAFAEAYSLSDGAAAAGVSESEASAWLAEPETRAAIDDLVIRRADSAAAYAARRAVCEFERIAFAEDEGVKPADRIRAMEQLIKLAPVSEDGGGIIINYGYRSANDNA